MNEIKEWKPLVKITLINWREIISNINIEKLEKAMSLWQMIKVNWILINSHSISTIENYNWNEIDQYIANITDELMKDRLLVIYNERKNKKLVTNWVKHLMQIFTDRFWEIKNDK